jgi:hypothetical protein
MVEDGASIHANSHHRMRGVSVSAGSKENNSDFQEQCLKNGSFILLFRKAPI